jgi:hypothetical protein
MAYPLFLEDNQGEDDHDGWVDGQDQEVDGDADFGAEVAAEEAHHRSEDVPDGVVVPEGSHGRVAFFFVLLVHGLDVLDPLFHFGDHGRSAFRQGVH